MRFFKSNINGANKEIKWIKRPLSKYNFSNIVHIFLIFSFIVLANSSIARPDDSRNGENLNLGRILQSDNRFTLKNPLDTTGIVLTVRNVRYKIPLNYLDYTPKSDLADKQLVSISVTFPKFLPYSKETEVCFGSLLKAREAGCEPIRFTVIVPYLSAEFQFQRIRNYFRNPVARQEKFGDIIYDVYDVGPDDARTEYYFTNSENRSVLFNCHFGRDRSNAICTDIFQLRDGNSVHLFARPDQRAEIPEIEDGIRNLMETFQNKE